MMAKLSIRCLYKRYHLLNVSVDNRVSALFESRRLFDLVNRRSLASAVSEPFSSPAKTVVGTSRSVSTSASG